MKTKDKDKSEGDSMDLDDEDEAVEEADNLLSLKVEGDQAIGAEKAKVSQPTVRVKRWEKRWVLVPNVYQFGEDVWVHKWLNE